MSSYRDFRPNVRFQPSLALSPDGELLAYADDATGQFNVVVQPLAGGDARRLTSLEQATVRSVVWHPSGQALVFFADLNGDENAQVYIVPVAGGVAEGLTTAPTAQHAPARGNPFSPDGRLLMYTSTERSSGDQDVALREMATGEVRRVYVGGGRVFAGFWAPDGKALTATHWIEGNSDHVIYLVPADGGPAKRLTPSDVTATYWLGPWLPDGSGFLVRSNAGREFTGLAKLDAATGDLTWLVTPDWDVEYAALSADGRVLLWLVNVDGSSELHARNLLTGLDLEVPRLPMCDVAAASLSADGRVAAFLISTPTKPANLAVVDLDDSGGALRWITDNKPDVDTSSFVTPELVRYRSQDGTEIPALLYRPLGIDQPVGVVLWIHGGPTAQERPVYQRDGFHQYLLQRGIAVFAPNVRGSDGYGASYIQRLYRDWGGIDLDDWAAAVEYLQRQSWVDPERIGVYGGSYGGFGALSCLARLPEINWAAGVDRCGISNLVTLATASPPALKSLVALVIGDPVADAEFLLARSPVTYADQIRAPLFIIQGANDPRVPQAESDQMVARLRQRGVEVRYDVYPDEGHAFMKAENQVKADSDAAEFLIAHLAV